MPLGLRFLPTPKRVKKVVDIEKAKSSDGIELKSLSDPLLNISCESGTAGFICKSESVHILPDIAYGSGNDTKTPLKASPSSHCLFGDMLPTSSDSEVEKATHTEDVVVSSGSCEEEIETTEEEDEINPLEIPEMVDSFFDRNGNPVDDAVSPEVTDTESFNPSLSEAAQPPELKCFINAADLIDDEPEYVPSPPPSLLFKTESANNASGTGSGIRKATVSPSSSGIPIRRRVPISKSFPDIIQTTILPRRDQDDDVFGFKMGGANRSNGFGQHRLGHGGPMQDSMVADSLEQIPAPPPVLGNIHRDSIDVSDGPSRPMGSHARVFERIESTLTESVIGGGITSEKPPETWIVDFNSFTSEGDDEQQLRERRKSTSSTNSLAYFLSMDEVDSSEPTMLQKQKQPDDLMTASTDSSKKMIFSMFVDLGAKESQQDIFKSKSTASDPTSHPIGSRTTKPDSSLRLKALHSGIPKYPHPHFPVGVKGGQDFKIGGDRGSMSSSMMMSSVSDAERSQFQGISNRSSLHVANHEHDGSFTSSILSSMEMSACDDSEICQGGPCFKLGMDLLRMFQEGINTDVAISVRGRFVKAHKCILASRSQYFAAMLSGNWIQKAGNTIHLDEFSYNTVQFTMYHIYSGTNEIPELIDLVELATLTDMLGLEGLREVISQTIRNRFCHNFHRPCTGCIAGILEFYPLAVNYGMDELQRKMTKWICKHFVRIWPTKAFATLGDPLIEKCLGFSISHLSPENLLDVTLGCDQLQSTMPTVRWTEAIFSTVNKLTEACVHYVGEHLSEVLQSQRFLLFGKGQTWNISRIENTFLEGILLLNANEACLSHVALCRLIELGTVTIDEVEWSTMFVVFLKMLRKEVEKFLLGNASKAVLSKNWELMSQDVRKRICATSFQDKSGNKGSVKTVTPGMTQGSVAVTPVAAPRNSRQSTVAAHTPANVPMTNKGRATRISPQQVKVSEAMIPQTKTPSPPSDFLDKRIPSPLPISESGQKSTSAKSVASVRPMQSQPQTPVAPPPSNSKTPNVYSSGRNVTSTTTWTNAGKGVAATNNANAKTVPTVAATRTPSAEPLHRRKTASVLEKERSFDTTSSRVSSAGSTSTIAARRGSVSRNTKPLTPSTPSPRAVNPPTSKALPLTTVQRKVAYVAEPPPPPAPKATFLTNSEKAKAVSKPKLVFRSQRSNSVSTDPPLSPIPTELKSHSRQGSVGSGMTFQGIQRTPNLTQSSRYANVKPKTNSEKTIKPPASPLPRSRFGNTPTKAGSIGNSGSNIGDTRSNGSGHGTGTYRVSRGRSANLRGKTEGEAPARRGKKSIDMDSSWQMSKSSIEMDSEGNEPKMRMLAEIGRSSTFSKDEPTVLGKMDVSIDYDVN